MKNSILLLSVMLLLAACKDGDTGKSAGDSNKKPDNPAHLLSKEGIGELKIGMTKTDIEKILKQSLTMKHANDTGEIWVDTATVKYAEMDVDLYFQQQYSYEGNATNEMELFAVSTNSSLARTASGLGIGDDRNAILSAYEDNPINMGPENVMLNDTTWGMSKTNYYINVSDDKWDKQIIFLLINKKVARVEATLAMGE